MGRLLGWALALALVVPATATAASITLPSAGGSGYTFSANGSTSDLIHFDAAFSGTLTFEYFAWETWTVRATSSNLAVGSCGFLSTTACYGNGTAFLLTELPLSSYPAFALRTWQLDNVLTLDFSYPPPSTSFLELRNILVTPNLADSPTVATPEPATLVLLGVGLGAARLVRRRRKV